jgi:hypothetical protein
MRATEGARRFEIWHQGDCGSEGEGSSPATLHFLIVASAHACVHGRSMGRETTAAAAEQR